MLNKIKLHAVVQKRKSLLLIAISMFANITCYREPINIDLSNFSNNIVIEGIIIDQLRTQSVKISRTVKYNQTNEFPPVSGALVAIEDDLNNFVQLYESEPGIYRTSSLLGIPGRTYTLKVMVDNKIYEASSTMPKPLVLKILDFESITPDNNQFKFSCSFSDHVGIEDYCLLNIYINGYLIDYYLYQDHVSDGQVILLDNFDVIFNQNDEATIELLTFDRATYEFYRTLDLMGSNDENDDEFVGPLIPVTTFNPTTNLNNGALGYFSAQTIRRYTKIPK